MNAATHKQRTGLIAYHSGQAAEAQIAAEYERRGHLLAARRWRGKGGEIDLVFQSSDQVVFVEVKRARSFSDAARRISAHQQARICCAAEEYLGTLPTGLLTPMRVDAAFVNGHGDISILENAITA